MSAINSTKKQSVYRRSTIVGTFTYIVNVFCGFSFFCALACQGGAIDGISKSVVFLSDTQPITEAVKGVPYEVWLKAPDTNAFIRKTRQVSGSGLIVVSSGVCYLITAKHVAVEMTEDCDVTMRGDDNGPIKFKLSSITGQRNFVWLHNPNVDLSIHPLPTVTLDGAKALSARGIPLDVLVADANLPSRDESVTALGFPLALGAEGEFIPLSRESKVSSGMLTDDGGKFFLLQDPSVSGYSGGPLFETGAAQFGAVTFNSSVCRCWGFVLGTYGDETGGKMSRITPAFYAVQMVREFERTSKIVAVTIPGTANNP